MYYIIWKLAQSAHQIFTENKEHIHKLNIRMKNMKTTI